MNLEQIKLNFRFKHNLKDELVDDILEIIKMSDDLNNSNNKIRFTFTENEFGEIAKEFYNKNGSISRAYIGDAGIDLPVMLTEEEQKHGSKKIWPNEREMLHTGIIMEFPIGYYGRIIHRSSTEKIHRLRVIEGVIDDYRGEILVQVHNQNTACVDIYHGSRIAQLILAKTCPFFIEHADKLRQSERGSNGFGSSGK